MKSLKLKKGDISMNMIVMATIAVLVLLVVIVIFMNQIKKPASEVGELNEPNGKNTAIRQGIGDDSDILGKLNPIIIPLIPFFRKKRR